MKIGIYQDAKQHLLSAFNLLAPTGKEQQAMVRIVHDMEDDGATPEQVCRTIAGSIADGLEYGNWPQ